MKSMRAYTVSDGKLVLVLMPDAQRGFSVTSPLDPGLVTQAKTIEEAFANAYDAAAELKKARKQLSKQLLAIPS